MVAVPQQSLMRWTVADVRRMIEAGAFAHPERFELVDGMILRKVGQNAPHKIALMFALEAMRAAYGASAKVLAGLPVALSETSEPEPDVVVVRPDLRGEICGEDVVLVVEVADTSLRTDQTVKAALYAFHGVPEYLLLDVVNRRAEIRRKPRGEAWGETVILAEDGEFTPRGASAPIRVADLLPEPETA